MTAPDFLDFVLAAWRADIDSVPFPSMTDLVDSRAQQNQPNAVSIQDRT